MEKLKHAYVAIEQGYEHMNLCLLDVEEANARSCVSFGRATCSTSMYEGDDKKKISFRAGSIFVYGLEVLKEFLDETNPCIPEDGPPRVALENFLGFFYLDPSSLFEYSSVTEGQWALRLAQHLLSPLSVPRSYLIDHYPCIETVLNNKICSCKAKDELVGRKGVTAFGCSKGWHGRSDILINDLPVDCTGTITGPEPLNENLSSVSSNEIKSSDKFYQKDINRILSQSIVFSFLQRKINERTMQLRNCLIPGIGISAKSIITYFYDCENDVLLGTIPLNLHADRELRSAAVVFIWLTLNYRIFCSGITEKMKNFKAHFYERVGDRIEWYLNDVTIPAFKTKTDDKECDYGWAFEQGMKGEIVQNTGIKFRKLGT